MARRVLIVPDKFKGTLTAQAAATHIARGWREVRPEDRLELLPMSDGGDGFGEVLARLLAAEARVSSTIDAAHRPWQGMWWWAPATLAALIESARIIGLAQLPPKRYHPFALDTQGLATIIQCAADAGSRQCLIGIGGSATNDGGFGLAKALGWSFIAASGETISQWTHLVDLARIDPPNHRLNLGEIIVAVDVQNLLLGPKGASRVYGPQKGLRPEDFPLAEACLYRLAEVVKNDLGFDAAIEPGTGAAGGLGFGLRSFLNARLESGFSLFARYAGLEERIRSADLVITGEGAIDDSTSMGKGVGEIARLCRKHNIPCLGLAGTWSMSPTGDSDETQLFNAVYGIAPALASPEAAIAEPELWLARLAADTARRWE